MTSGLSITAPFGVMGPRFRGDDGGEWVGEDRMDVLMPQLGETVAEGKISRWFVAAGDAVKPGDNLFEIETDKVSMEVPAIAAGTLAEIRVSAGEVAPVGAVVAIIQRNGEAAAPVRAQPAPQAPLVPAKAGVQGQTKKDLDSRLRGNERHVAGTAVTKPAASMEPFREVRTPERNYGPARLPSGTVVTPLARRLAGEAGIDLANIKGSGPHGRIIAADIETARKAPALAPLQATNIVLTADVELSQANALCADVAAIEFTDIIVKAWAAALARVMPSESSDVALIAGKNRTVIRDASSKSLTAIAAARSNGDATDRAQGAKTAISMPGIPGITSVADVLQLPQTTLLSIGAPRRAPIEAPDGSAKFTDMMTATLTCDPRAVDAALGAELLSAFKGFLERPVTMIV
jgi:pyruvate dehydrogenase E2 component (dihydrolipoamide acetyltransferase)